jgi:hypothetical protein
LYKGVPDRVCPEAMNVSVAAWLADGVADAVAGGVVGTAEVGGADTAGDDAADDAPGPPEPAEPAAEGLLLDEPAAELPLEELQAAVSRARQPITVTVATRMVFTIPFPLARTRVALPWLGAETAAGNHRTL